MWDEEELLGLRRAVEALPHTLEIRFHGSGESEFGQQLRSFLDTLVRISQGKIAVVQGNAEADLPVTPCFSIPGGGGRKVAYAALPEGHQFAPFVKVLAAIARSGVVQAPASPAPPRLRSGAEIWVLVSPHCPRCPRVVEAATELVVQEPQLSLLVIDAQWFPALAEARGVRAVPATVIDRSLVIIGSVSTDRLAEVVGMRGTADFDAEVFRSLVERGRIAEAVEHLRSGKGRAPILSLLQEPDLSKRMSALVVLENALEIDPAAVRAMVPSLLGLLTHGDSRIRGDVADFLGRTGDKRAIPPLENLRADPDPDVADAAAEALALLRDRPS
jgi:hypothetical protein